MPDRILASNPPQELSADPRAVTVNANRVATASPERWTFRLGEIAFSDSRCASFGIATVKSFGLTAQKGDSETFPPHADIALPEIRGCPLRYAISDVVIHELKGAKRVFAILLSSYADGFEGPNRRFLAVTARVP